MKKKLALLMAAIMTVALVPTTAFASTKLTAVDEITAGVDKIFTSRVEIKKSNDQVNVITGNGSFDVYVTLTNGKFATVEDDDDEYQMDSVTGPAVYAEDTGIVAVDVISDTKAIVTLDEVRFNQNDDYFAQTWKANWKQVPANLNAAEDGWKDANAASVKAAWVAVNAADVKDAWVADNAADVKADWITENAEDVKDAWIAAHSAELKALWLVDWKGEIANTQPVVDALLMLNPLATPEEIQSAIDAAAEAAYAPEEAAYLDTAYAAVENSEIDAAYALVEEDEIDAAYAAVENSEIDAAYALVEDAQLEAAYEALTDEQELAVINDAADAAFIAANPDYAGACVLPIIAKATATGDVTATFTSNITAFKKASEVIATAVDGKVDVTSDGVKTFVEDSSTTSAAVKDITIKELTSSAITGEKITLKLKGNWEYTRAGSISFLNQTLTSGNDYNISYNSDDNEMYITFTAAGIAKLANDGMLTQITVTGLTIKTTKKCDSGDTAVITVSSKDFDSVKIEVAKMVEEAVTYSVEDKTLPTIWAGKNYSDEDANTLKISIVENAGDILNTSRKATFTFPEGIEVVNIASQKGLTDTDFKYEIDENVVTIYNYSKGDSESDKVDMSLKFILNAAPTFSGDVKVTLGGQFDDTSFKVATVEAPYTVTAKTSDVLIDYRYVPVNDIVITEAEDGILDDDDVIVLAVEKMDFEDAGDVKVTEGDIDVDADIDDYNDGKYAYLVLTVNDASTEASTIVISGLELYLDRTLPVGGYALQNVAPNMSSDKDHIVKPLNILWENSTLVKGSSDDDAYDYTPGTKEASNGLFKYKEVTVNDSYVNVVTAARDQDDSMITKKVVITVGATTMAAGTETVALDAPAYINTANYTMLPLRAISEAFKATVNWDDASKTVTILSGQRIISMTIGSRTMYVNGTPVAMNTAPEITASRTFIPVRDLANAFGISNINWTEASGTVTLN